MVVGSLKRDRRADGAVKPIFQGLADEFVNRITGNSVKAPESALPKTPGVGQAPWESKAISELKWWDVRHIRRGEQPDIFCVVSGARDVDEAAMPEVPVTVPAGSA
eukprot:11246-Alexandrium_andersonii.AAC.1